MENRYEIASTALRNEHYNKLQCNLKSYGEDIDKNFFFFVLTAFIATDEESKQVNCIEKLGCTNKSYHRHKLPIKVFTRRKCINRVFLLVLLSLQLMCELSHTNKMNSHLITSLSEFTKHVHYFVVCAYGTQSESTYCIRKLLRVNSHY